MRKIYTKVKDVVKNLYIKIKPIIAKGIKLVYKIIRRMLLLLSTLAFLIVPFLNSCIDSSIAQCVWYPSFSIMVILLARESAKKGDLNDRERIVNYLANWSLWALLFVFLSIFVMRYYHIIHIWLWVIFGVVAIYTFLFFQSLWTYNLKYRELTKEERQKTSINVVKYILLYWLFDLTYMGIFNDWFWTTIICGTLAVTFVLYNLALAFFNVGESLKGWLILELLFGMGTAVYLIYIIPDETLQSIIVTIVAAVFGGLFTLIGVAWTIKKGDIDRREDERKKNIPYMKVVHGIKESCEVCALIHNGLDLCSAKELEKADGNSLYLITIQDCIMKNISESNIILRGMLFNDKKYDFAEPAILEKGEVCKIRVTDNCSIIVPNAESSLKLIVNDTMGNIYSIECKLNYTSEERSVETLDEECECGYFEFTCLIGSVKLPVLIDVKNK